MTKFLATLNALRARETAGFVIGDLRDPYRGSFGALVPVVAILVRHVAESRGSGLPVCGKTRRAPAPWAASASSGL